MRAVEGIEFGGCVSQMAAVKAHSDLNRLEEAVHVTVGADLVGGNVVFAIFEERQGVNWLGVEVELPAIDDADQEEGTIHLVAWNP